MGKVIKVDFGDKKELKPCPHCGNSTYKGRIISIKKYMEMKEKNPAKWDIFRNCTRNRVKCTDGTTYSPATLYGILNDIFK